MLWAAPEKPLAITRIKESWGRGVELFREKVSQANYSVLLESSNLYDVAAFLDISAKIKLCF